MLEGKCGNCGNWQRDGSDGICRKNSPRPTIMEQGKTYIIVWPRTNANEPCCGDYIPFIVGEVS